MDRPDLHSNEDDDELFWKPPSDLARHEPKQSDEDAAKSMLELSSRNPAMKRSRMDAGLVTPGENKRNSKRLDSDDAETFKRMGLGDLYDNVSERVDDEDSKDEKKENLKPQAKLKHKRYVWTSESLHIALGLLFEYYAKVPKDGDISVDVISWHWIRDEIYSRGHHEKFHHTHLKTTAKLHQCERSIAAWLKNGKRDKTEILRNEPRKELSDEEALWYASEKNPFNRKKLRGC